MKIIHVIIFFTLYKIILQELQKNTINFYSASCFHNM